MASTEGQSLELLGLASIPALQQEELQHPVMVAPLRSSSFLLAASSAQEPEAELAPASVLDRYPHPVRGGAVPLQAEHSS